VAGFVKATINLRVPQNARNSSTTWGSIDFSKSLLIVILLIHVITMWRFPFSIVEYGQVTPLYAIMSYKGVEIELHSFLTSAVNGSE